MKQKASILRLTLTLLVITSAVSAVLAGVNMLTKDKIAAMQEKKTLDAVAQVMEGDATLLTDVPCEGMIQAVYDCANGYAVQVSTVGFGGDMVMIVGVTHAGKVTGVSIISHTETAGLGAVAADDSAKGKAFREQFTQLTGPFAVTKDGGQVDAITGATVTSRAVTQGINAALEFAEFLDGEDWS